MIQGPIDKVQALPTLHYVADAYAFVVFSPLMEPRYFVGEVVYVHPGLPIQNGDFALVRCKGGQVGIIRIIEIDSERVSMAFLADGVLHTHDLHEIESIEKIVGSATRA